MDVLADACFLIDLWRESRSSGRAIRFARENRDRRVGICWVVQGEFLSGGRAAKQDVARLQDFLAAYPVVHSNAAIVESYARVYAELRAKNRMIGPNDLWIAAVCLSLGLPLLSRNAAEFSRIEDLELIDYTQA